MSYEIPKLKGMENWFTWKYQVRDTLIWRGAWDVVIYTWKLPEQTAGTSADPIEILEINLFKDSWKKKDSIAQEVITTSMEEHPLLHIINCKTSKAMWDKLTSVYEQESEKGKDEWYMDSGATDYMSKNKADGIMDNYIGREPVWTMEMIKKPVKRELENKTELVVTPDAPAQLKMEDLQKQINELERALEVVKRKFRNSQDQDGPNLSRKITNAGTHCSGTNEDEQN